MNLILQTLIFLIFAFIAFYLPGKFISEKLNISFNQLERLVILPVIGVFFYTGISIILRLMGFPFVFVYILLVGFVLGYVKNTKIHLKVPPVKLYGITLIIVLLAGAVSQTKFVVMSHDTFTHLAVIGELKNHFPPEHPTYANEALKNYHYLPDFLIAGINSSIPSDKFNLYFKILPFTASLYFGLSSYMVAAQFLRNKFLRILAVSLAYFSGSFAFLIPLFGNETEWKANTFMLDQPFDLPFNPQYSLAFVIFLVGTHLIVKFQKLGKIAHFYLAGIIFALAFGFKSYTSIIGLIGVIAVAFHLLIFRRKIEGFKVALVSIFIFSISALLLVNNARNGLHLSPGWILKRMVEDPDRLNTPLLSILEQHYLEKNNYLRVVQINIREVATYIFGNLGTRVLGFLFILTFLKKINKLSAEKVFIITVVLSSLSIPLLFNQGGSAYNIIQFGPYALILTSIFSAIVLEKIYEKMNFIKQKNLFIVIILVFLALSIPVNIKTFIERLDTEKFEVTNSELDVLQYLKEKTNKDSIILVYPTKKNLSFSYVSALSERRVFLSDAVQIELTSLDFETRHKDLVQFFKANELKQTKEFLKENKITYIYLTAEDEKAAEDNVFFLGLESIIKNDSASLYRVNN